VDISGTNLTRIDLEFFANSIPLAKFALAGSTVSQKYTLNKPKPFIRL
jgi:hypothetical protein